MLNLETILSEGESYTVEFKESADKTIASEVCAFANAAGGRIFIGVDDSGNIVGTDTSNSARSRLQDTINQIDPRLIVDITVHDKIIVVIVPEGSNKPYACAQGFYLRTGPNSQKLERDSIIEFFQNEGQIRYDEIIRRDLLLTEKFDENAYKRYVRTAKISDVHDRETILTNLNCAVNVDGRFYFTNAGALFFRKNDEDVKFRHAGIVCALYKGTEKAIIIDAKELNGDVVSNIDDALTFLKRHLNITYKIETLRRQNILELPEGALREAIVNAVCHRNYFEKGARVMVEVFDDRVEITSPGGVCKGITPENFGKISITRNAIVASMLYRIDYIEQMGTGIKRMRNAAQEAGVEEPEFELIDFFKVIFKRKTIDDAIGNQSVTNRSQSFAIDKLAIENDKLAIENSDKISIILKYIKQNGSGKNMDLVKLLGLSSQRIRQILQEMIQNNLIEKHSDKRHTYYTAKE